MLHSDSAPQGAPTTLTDTCAQAMKLHIAGQLDVAEQLYREILQAEPKHAAANHCIGMLQVQLQRPADGLPYLLTAVNENPESADYWLGYLEALLLAGAVEDAERTLALGRQHGLAGASVDAFALRLQARSPQADAELADPRQERLLGDRHEAALLTMINERRFVEAANAARRLTQRFPKRSLGWKTLGALLWAEGEERAEDALAAMRIAVELMPGDTEANCNLATSLAKLQRFDEAHTYFSRALQIDPRSAAAHYRLAMSYDMQGRFAESEASLWRAITLRSGPLTADDELGHTNLLYMLSHNPAVDADSLYREHCRVGQLFEAGSRKLWPRHRNDAGPGRPLQVGFVSGDFNNHAVASFLEPVLAQLCKYQSLELHAYCNNVIEDHVTQRLRGHVAHWHPISGLSDALLAQKIMADRIDILVDLSGYTSLHRLRAFARKPAPLQMSWLGYVGTTGLRAMDYYLSDRHFSPRPQFDRQYIEKLVHLPAAAPFLPHAASPPVNSLPALDAGYITFGSFNRVGKINAPTIELWCKLLLAVPRSQMLLGAISADSQRDRLIAQFAALGIARERLIFHARAGMDIYLALHHRVDICLDTQPWTGGTTTNHALWMGVPTLATTGSTPASRLSAALLGQVGLTTFVAANTDELIEKGIYWANHLPELAAVRALLRDRCRESPARQPDTIAAAMERAFRHMWIRWCARLPPESFEITQESVSPRSG